ncbi:MAG: HAD family hydrolase [Candidatus Hodarchaeales archaeon]|jgi:HAD superfamily hydrolase (TIGR01509 family)
MIKAIIFDLDGLIVDTERLYDAVDHILATEFGKTVDHKIIAQMMGQKPLDAVTIFRDSLELNISPVELLQKRDLILMEKFKTDLSLMPGLYEAITPLHDKYRLAIATGAPQRFVKVILDYFDLWNFFEVIQDSDDILHGKPDPEIFLKTIERLNLIPHDCVVLEDSSNGALAAKRAGCYTVAIPTIYTKQQDFSFADYLAADLIAAKEHILAISD